MTYFKHPIKIYDRQFGSVYDVVNKQGGMLRMALRALRYAQTAREEEQIVNEMEEHLTILIEASNMYAELEMEND